MVPRLSEPDERVGGCGCAAAASSLSVPLPSRAVSYLHVTIELDVNGLAAVRCQEVRAVIGNNQVEEGVLLDVRHILCETIHLDHDLAGVVRCATCLFL